MKRLGLSNEQRIVLQLLVNRVFLASALIAFKTLRAASFHVRVNPSTTVLLAPATGMPVGSHLSCIMIHDGIFLETPLGVLESG
jgi:hypothetical protein